MASRRSALSRNSFFRSLSSVTVSSDTNSVNYDFNKPLFPNFAQTLRMLVKLTWQSMMKKMIPLLLCLSVSCTLWGKALPFTSSLQVLLCFQFYFQCFFYNTLLYFSVICPPLFLFQVFILLSHHVMVCLISVLICPCEPLMKLKFYPYN